MWESHYLFSNINFNSVSALRISILLLSSLKNFIIFFKIKPSLGIDNNIIPRINKSMSKNTESTDITKFFVAILHNQDIYLIKHTCILIEKNLHSQALGSGLNPRGVLDFNPLYFFGRRKILLQGN